MWFQMRTLTATLEISKCSGTAANPITYKANGVVEIQNADPTRTTANVVADITLKSVSNIVIDVLKAQMQLRLSVLELAMLQRILK